jgi:hypothetical protein
MKRWSCQRDPTGHRTCSCRAAAGSITIANISQFLSSYELCHVGCIETHVERFPVVKHKGAKLFFVSGCRFLLRCTAVLEVLAVYYF